MQLAMDVAVLSVVIQWIKSAVKTHLMQLAMDVGCSMISLIIKWGYPPFSICSSVPG